MTDVTVSKTEQLKGEVCAPASKAYTQRMLIASALASGKSRISGPLCSDDTEATLRAIIALGAKVSPESDCWTVDGTETLKAAAEPIDCGESGATSRFMIPVAALASKPTVFVFGSGLAKRPIEPLLFGLRELGAEAVPQKVGDKQGILVKGGGLKGGETSLPGDVSSQFVSGLMFACPLARADTDLTITSPLESRLYVKMTQNVLAEHGVKVDISEDYRHIHISSGQKYMPHDGKVPGDFSSAAFLLAAAAIAKSEVRVKNLDYRTVQGDKVILGILKKMGVDGNVCLDSVQITGDGGLLEPVNVDAREIPDLVPVCVALACFASGVSKIHDARRLRLKESDRLASIYLELRKMGADIAMDEDSLVVKGPSRLFSAVIDPRNDHRIAMACAVAALRAEGETVIQRAECVRKSYPQFFNDLRAIGVDVVGWKFDR